MLLFSLPSCRLDDVSNIIENNSAASLLHMNGRYVWVHLYRSVSQLIGVHYCYNSRIWLQPGFNKTWIYSSDDWLFDVLYHLITSNYNDGFQHLVCCVLFWFECWLVSNQIWCRSVYPSTGFNVFNFLNYQWKILWNVRLKEGILFVV